MVAFQSAKKGLDCAIAIQRAFDGHNAADGEHVKVRIGLHAGEAIKDGDDFYGKNVILASRVAGKAVGGEILVSSLVRALVESSVEPGTFGDAREVELKGLAGTHTVYAVSGRGAMNCPAMRPRRTRRRRDSAMACGGAARARVPVVRRARTGRGRVLHDLRRVAGDGKPKPPPHRPRRSRARCRSRSPTGATTCSRFLGEGGRKRVYLAHDTKLDRDVAFAAIKTDGLDDDGVTRIRREAQAMGTARRSRAHRHRLRHRRGDGRRRRRRAVHRQPVHGRRRAHGPDRRGRTAARADRRRRAHRDAGRAGAGARAQARHRPPRPQARQRLAHRRGHREDRRLRPRRSRSTTRA